MNLHELLEDGVRYSPRYLPSQNSDHLPMMLCAMKGLGASDTQIIAFRDIYAKRLHECEPGPDISDWHEGLGLATAYPALLTWFRETLAQGGIEDIMSAVLATCLPGIALDAFHPIIRLGYAREFDSEVETAAALAYMTSVHAELPVSFVPVDLWQGLQEQAAVGPLPLSADRFGGSILELADRGWYPCGSAGGFEELAAVSLQLYQSTRNFFALHLVTATHALRCAITPQTKALGIAAMSGAILAAHRVLGCPVLSASALPVEKSLDPEHVCKYLWVCLSEYQEYGEPEYLEEFDRFRQAGLVPGWLSSERFVVNKN